VVRNRAWTIGRPAYNDVVMTGDSDRVAVESSKGVLFRATDSPDWNVTVDGRPVTAYPAGPDYMYVPLDTGVGGRETVGFRYQPSLTEWAAIAISTGTLLVLALYLFDVPTRIDRWIRPLRAHL
jgi:hypothetical protein